MAGEEGSRVSDGARKPQERVVDSPWKITTNPPKKEPLLRVPFIPLHRSLVSSFQLIPPARMVRLRPSNAGGVFSPSRSSLMGEGGSEEEG